MMSTAQKQPMPASQRSGVTARRLHAVYPQMCDRVGIASIPLEICDAIERAPELRSRFAPFHWVSAASLGCIRPYQRGRTHPLLAKLAYHCFSDAGKVLRRRTVRQLVADVCPGDIVLVYPGIDAGDAARLREQGAIVVHDPVNTAHRQWCVAMQRAYVAAGMSNRVVIDEVAHQEEQRRMQPQDAYFVTSPLVQASIQSLGIPTTRMIQTSYGFDASSFQIHRSQAATTRFVFVAQGSVRKGLPVLLRAWAEAGQPGRLAVVGVVDAEVAKHCERLLALPTVEVRPYTRDLAAVYSEADVFVLTSFEEGSPLVTYLAMAAGLPSLLSLPAAGWVMRPDRECMLVEPDDVAAIADGLRQLASDEALRRRLGDAARIRSADYTWDRVTAQRLAALERLLEADAQG